LYWTWRWPYIKAETFSRLIVQIHVLIKYILYRSCVDLNEHYIILIHTTKMTHLKIHLLCFLHFLLTRVINFFLFRCCVAVPMIKFAGSMYIYVQCTYMFMATLNSSLFAKRKICSLTWKPNASPEHYIFIIFTGFFVSTE
jgi:hypothetical protein